MFVEAIASIIWASTSGDSSGSASLRYADTLPDELSDLCSNLHKRWISYDDVVQAVTTELSSKIPLWEFLHASRISKELSKAGIIRFKAIYRNHLNGSEVIVWKNGSFPIYWASPSGSKYKFIMRAPQSSLDVSSGQRKYIFL